MMKEISIIITVAPGDGEWKKLVGDLKFIFGKAEIILASAIKPENLPAGISWAECKGGRAKCLNAGAKMAGKKFLWFLHADSRLDNSTLKVLENALLKKPLALHYFQLEFLDDGPNLMWLNAIFANLRSRILLAPFGDQGFCIQKDIFEKIGGYPEGLAYGEDNVFVWRTRKAGIKLSCAPAHLLTSARKYEEQGWPKTTFDHLWLWAKQTFALALGKL